MANFAIIESDSKVCIFGDSLTEIFKGNDEYRPICIDTPIPIVSIASGETFILFLDKEGNVYCSGLVPESERYNFELMYSQVKAISSFGNYFMLLNKDGSIDIFDNVDMRHYPYNGTIYEKVTCGDKCYFAIDDTGNCWALGDNSYGKLGTGDFVSRQFFEPLQKQGDGIDTTSIKSIAAGPDHTIFLDHYGNVYGCGDSFHGQLGGHIVGGIFLPILIFNQVPIKSVHCGNYFTMLVDIDGNLWTAGNNIAYYPGSGLPGTFDQFTLQEFDIGIINTVICYKDSAILINELGECYGYGRNDFQQLGIGNINLGEEDTNYHYIGFGGEIEGWDVEGNEEGPLFDVVFKPILIKGISAKIERPIPIKNARKTVF